MTTFNGKPVVMRPLSDMGKLQESRRETERIESIILEDEDGEIVEVTAGELFRMFKYVKEVMSRLGL